MNKRHPELIVSILVLVLALVACENTTIPGPGMPLGLDDYANSDVMNALSVSLNGIPVVIIRSNGLRYAILLSSSSAHNRIGLS
jgi:hypothetical protein